MPTKKEVRGLTNLQVKKRLKEYGLNTILEQKKKPIYVKFFEQFNNFLIILLIFASVFSFFINEVIDGSLILIIIILNAFFGIYQEIKAEEAISSLKKMTTTNSRVIRQGKEIEISSKYVVPGDIVFIEEGTKIVADGKVIRSISLQIDESSMTGESLAVKKDINDEVSAGTMVASGRGLYEVQKTGMRTKFGKIAKNISAIKETKTPLQKKLTSLTKIIGIVGLVVSLFAFIFSLVDGSGYFPSFLLAISLAVALVPEGLPAAMTITLAIGVKIMTKKKSIIRKLSAIEALGSITMIVTDKTGTLTENKMKVKELFFDNKKIVLGRIKEIKNLSPTVSRLVLDGILCSTASLVYIHDNDSWDVLGDPTEGALLYLAKKLSFDIEEERKSWLTVKENSFNSIKKRMSVLVKKENKNIVFSKGAPESILSACDRLSSNGKNINLGKEQRSEIEHQINEWAKKGLRVLAFSYKENKTQKERLVDDGKMIFLGMVAIYDAPRPEVLEAVNKARKAGIKIVIVTGDNEKTTEAVGVVAGIVKEGDGILLGNQLESYSDDELLKMLPRIKIFARTNPFQKHRIVKLYQQLQEIVAVTGDGVNDAIALKQADVGVAMGLVGTDVARETADMVITDDNFASIVNAIEEGRNIIKNLKNAIKYLLACNVAEAISIIAGLLMNLPTLFYPIQLLYINLVTDGLPALALAFSPRNPNIMRKKPEKNLTILNKTDFQYIFLVSLVSSLLVLFAFYFYQNFHKSAVFSVLVLIQSFIFIDLWLTHRPIFKNFKSLLNPFFLISFFIPFVFQFFILRFSSLAFIFKIKVVSISDYLGFIIIAGVVLFGIKIVKKIIKI